MAALLIAMPKHPCTVGVTLEADLALGVVPFLVRWLLLWLLIVAATATTTGRRIRRTITMAAPLGSSHVVTLAASLDAPSVGRVGGRVEATSGSITQHVHHMIEGGNL